VSYCNRASCLTHRRAMYWNLQTGEWVHTDGWPCTPADVAAAWDALPGRAPAAELAEPRDQAPGPAEVYAAVTLDAISRAGDLAYAVYVVGLYQRKMYGAPEPARPVAEFQCCGDAWIPYPAPGRTVRCGTCLSVFAVEPGTAVHGTVTFAELEPSAPEPEGSDQ